MGTWGTGPLDNDDAMDLVDVIGFDPSRYREIILARLMPMTDMMVQQPRSADELAEDMQGALAACAIVADVRCGEHFYTSTPEEPEDFRLEAVERQDDLEVLARQALGMYRKMEAGRVDLGWRGAASYDEHRTHLSTLEKRLSS